MYVLVLEEKRKVVKLTEEERKWNKVWDMWADGTLESPYNELLEYSSQVNGGGHLCFFDNVSGEDISKLDKVISVLLDTLPTVFVSKLKRAYDSYCKDSVDKEGDKIASEKTVKYTDELDNIFYDNEELVNGMIREYSNSIELE